jgi:hypothetical protein
MAIVRSVNNVPLRLTEERWNHVRTRHPEMSGLLERVHETVSEPDLVQQGDRGDLLAIRRYPDTPLSEKYIVVAYREVSERDGFLLTAYLTSEFSPRRRVVWTP